MAKGRIRLARGTSLSEQGTDRTHEGLSSSWPSKASETRLHVAAIRRYEFSMARRATRSLAKKLIAKTLLRLITRTEALLVLGATVSGPSARLSASASDFLLNGSEISASALGLLNLLQLARLVCELMDEPGARWCSWSNVAAFLSLFVRITRSVPEEAPPASFFSFSVFREPRLPPSLQRLGLPPSL